MHMASVTPLATAAASASAFGDAAAVGTGTTAARSDHRHSRETSPLPSAGRLASGQSFTTNNTLADLTGMSQPIAANEECDLDIVLEFTAGGLGGWKVALTGPAVPTSVFIAGLNVTPSVTVEYLFATAFAAAIASAGTAQAGMIVVLHAHVRNGTNAGTLQLQGAQSSSHANTTTFGAGSYIAKRRRVL